MISADEDNIGLLFTLYKSSVLFPVNRGNNLNSDGSVQTVVGSHIIAATVGFDLELRNLEDNVTIVLQLTIPEQDVSLAIYIV